jgi:hypothetical protein
MRIVSWNLNRASWSQRKHFSNTEDHRRAAWTVLATLGADLALVQEASAPPLSLDRPPLSTIPAADDSEAWRSPPFVRRAWCSAIASWREGLEPVPPSRGRESLEVSHPGAYRLASLPWRTGRLFVVSVYALWDYSWLRPGDRLLYSETSLHRTLSDLTPVLDVARSKVSIVLAGDLNASTQFPPPARDAYRLVHDRIATLGLQNVSVRPDDEDLADCPCVDIPCRHIRTLDTAKPIQDDYVYASPDVAGGLRLINIDRTAEMTAVSDHYPLVVDLSD